MKRVGILTSGGDCQGLNATIRAVAKTLYNQLGNDVEIIGIIDGYRGLIYGETRKMKPENFSGILTMGGTILGTSRQPFKLMRVVDENSVDKVEAMKKNYKSLALTVLSYSAATELKKPQIFFVKRDSMWFRFLRQLTTTFGVQTRHSVFRVPLILQQM